MKNIKIKQKSKLSIIVSIMLLFFLVSFLGMSTAMAEHTGNVQVTYTSNENLAYPLLVDVNGKGELSNGAEILRNRQGRYLLVVGDTVVFEIKPDKGVCVSSVKLNGEEIVSEVKNNQIVVKGAEKKQVLSVNFGAAENMTENPRTGKNAKANTNLLLIILLVCIGMVHLIKSRKM